MGIRKRTLKIGQISLQTDLLSLSLHLNLFDKMPYQIEITCGQQQCVSGLNQALDKALEWFVMRTHLEQIGKMIGSLHIIRCC